MTTRKHSYMIVRKATITDDIAYSITWPDHTPYNKKIAEMNIAIDDFISTVGAMTRFVVEIDDVAFDNVKYLTSAKYDIVRCDTHLLLTRRSAL